MILSILNFIRTGNLGKVQLGQNMDEIAQIFPEPDDKDKLDEEFTIWSYGAFEFHFFNENLILLWCDNLPYLGNPRKKQFKWDLWMLKKKHPMTLSKFINSMNREKIPFTLNGNFHLGKDSPYNIRADVKDTDSIIYFENSTDHATSIYKYKMVAIGASKMKEVSARVLQNFNQPSA